MLTSDLFNKPVEENCKYGRYYCTTDKKYKCRQGPKQTRASESVKQGLAEGFNGISVDIEPELDYDVVYVDINGKKYNFNYWYSDEKPTDELGFRKDIPEYLKREEWYNKLDFPTKMEVLHAVVQAELGNEPSEYRPTVGDEPLDEQGQAEEANPIDTVEMDVPLLIRALEYAREDAKDDMDLHKVVERMIAAAQSGEPLNMDDYNMIFGEQEVTEKIAYEPDEKGLQHMSLTMPQNAVVIDTPGDLDWYKLGHDIANLQQADPHEYGQSDSDMVIIPASDEEMKKLLVQLDRLGMRYKLIGGTHDQPEIHDEKFDEAKRKKKSKSKSSLMSKPAKRKYGGYYYPGYGYYGDSGDSGGGDGGGGESRINEKKDKTKLSTLDLRSELDAHATTLLNIARKKYPMAKSDLAALIKLLDRVQLHSIEKDTAHDKDIKAIRRDVAALEKRVNELYKKQKVKESRLYYSVTGTLNESLRKDFKMRKDRKGWFLPETASVKQKLDAERAFGEPIAEMNLLRPIKMKGPKNPVAVNQNGNKYKNPAKLIKFGK